MSSRSNRDLSRPTCSRPRRAQRRLSSRLKKPPTTSTTACANENKSFIRPPSGVGSCWPSSTRHPSFSAGYHSRPRTVNTVYRPLSIVHRPYIMQNTFTQFENFGHSLKAPSYHIKPESFEDIYEAFQLAKKMGLTVTARGA